MDQVRAHRREEAMRGFPLLRGCPSTVVLRRFAALDRLSEAALLDYADQLSALVEVQEATPLSLADRAALVPGLPLVARVEADVPTRPELRFQTVKSLARLAAEPGGIAGFVELQGLDAAAAGPPAPHVKSFAEAVPVPPARLRKVVLTALAVRFAGEMQQTGTDMAQLRTDGPGGRMVLTVDFAAKGSGAMSKQLSYSLWADRDGVRVPPTSYEALWLLPAQWDLITAGNVETVAQHLVRVVEARLRLAG